MEAVQDKVLRTANTRKTSDTTALWTGWFNTWVIVCNYLLAVYENLCVHSMVGVYTLDPICSVERDYETEEGVQGDEGVV